MGSHFLDHFFRPGSVALIGATSSPGFGYGIPGFWKKTGWLSKAHLVNPKGGEIQGKKVHQSISELPDGIDLAIVIVPANHVRNVLVELGQRG